MEGHILNLAAIKKLFLRYKPYLLALGGLLVGFSLSSTLLLYSGKELVNAIVYLFFVVLLPALFSTITLLLLLFKRDAQSKEGVKSSFLFGLFFSLGALVALLITVTTQDIAFGWATTLAVSAKEISSIANSLAFWKGLCSSCVVDEHLAAISQITRLGSPVSAQQIAAAKELGGWWKFLAMSIVVYGIIYRGVLLVFVSILPTKSASLFESEANSDSFDGLKSRAKSVRSKELLKNKTVRLIAYDSNSLEGVELESKEDAKDIVVAIDAWEPPILEFFDYLEDLEKEANSVSILLLGLNGGEVDKNDIAIWQDKLEELQKEYEVYV